MTIHKATDGRGTWYGSLDGETWVLFQVEPMPGGEKTIRAGLEVKEGGTLAARLGRTQPLPVTRAELVKRRFKFTTAKK